MGYNKFVKINDDGTSEVKFDLTSDTVEPSALLVGYTATDHKGDKIDGECIYDAYTSDTNALQSEILSGKTAVVNKKKLTGSMPNKGKYTASLQSKDDKVSIPKGYHDGSGFIEISATEKAKLVGSNIRKGINILGQEGELEDGSQEVRQSKTTTPKFESQTILPDSGYTCLSQVTVNAIPYTETENAFGGITITIG